MTKNKRKETKEEIGSRTAKTGFINEKLIVTKFDNWNSDKESKEWLAFIGKHEGFVVDDIDYVIASTISGRYKSDILVKISLNRSNRSRRIEVGISLKKQNEQGYNHIHREKPQLFAERFDFSLLAKTALLKYCGYEGFSPYDLYKANKITFSEYNQYADIPEKKKHSEGTGRFFFDELSTNEQKSLLNHFQGNIEAILRYILRTGKEQDYHADYVICTKKIYNDQFLFNIETINEIIKRAYSNGQVALSKKREHPSIHMGSLTIQRKGGTAGASNIQFKWTNIFPNKN